jgi:inorganic pyrophosphatase
MADSSHNALAAFGDSGKLQVVIETPKRSHYKYKYDEKLGLFRISRCLPAGSYFPYDFGYIPGTRGADGDPLDMLVMLHHPTFPGCLLKVELLGVLEAEQTEKDGKTVRNDRLIGRMEGDHPRLDSAKQWHGDFQKEIEQFFVSYNALDGKKFTPLGWHGPKRAQALLEQGIVATAKRKRRGKGK